MPHVGSVQSHPIYYCSRCPDRYGLAGNLPMLPARILSGARHRPGSRFGTLLSTRTPCWCREGRCGAAGAEVPAPGQPLQREAARDGAVRRFPGNHVAQRVAALPFRPIPRLAECRPSRPPDARRGGRRGHRRARGESADTGGVSWTRLAPPRHGVAKPRAQETILAAVVDPPRSAAARRRGGSEGGRATPSTGRRASGSGPRDPLVFRVEGRYPIV